MIGFTNYLKLGNQIVYMIDYDFQYDKIKIIKVTLGIRAAGKHWVGERFVDVSDYFTCKDADPYGAYYNGFVHKTDVFRILDSAVAEMRKRIKAKYEEHLKLLKQAKEEIYNAKNV